MRKIFLFMMISVDGYFEGTHRQLDWHNVDAEFNTFAVQQLAEADLLLFGRKTYDLMASYWPTGQGKADDSMVAERMNTTKKIVFSRTVTEIHWQNTELRTSVNPNEIKKLKEQSGKNIAILGSSNLCISFLEAGLLDEIRVMINPLVLGEGHTFLTGLHKKVSLLLTETKTFKSGNVLLYYKVIK